MIIDN